MTSRRCRPRCSPRSRPIATTRTHGSWRRSAASGTSRCSICSSGGERPRAPRDGRRPRRRRGSRARASSVARPREAGAKALDEHPSDERSCTRSGSARSACATRRRPSRRSSASRLEASRAPPPAPGGARRPERRGRRQRVARRLAGEADAGGTRAAEALAASERPRPNSSAAAGAPRGRSSPSRSSAPGCDAHVRAAGGVVVAARGDGVEEILIVHRPAYDDWSFPKGKCEPGESEEEAAVREVEEETGLRCRLERELATTRYGDARAPEDRPLLADDAGGRTARGRERGRRGALRAPSPRRERSSRTSATVSSSSCWSTTP